jgi:glycosyltransferase involved in cell wall biosynthesis
VTALVAAYGDVDALSQHVVALLDDDDRRTAIATAGCRYVKRFNWEHTGELLEAFLARYVAEPAAYGHAAHRG